MRPFEAVRFQEHAAGLVESAFEAGRLAHAYLFAGPEGVGRLTAALGLAAAIVCEEDDSGYCGECRHCKRVFSFDHPDVRVTLPLLGSTTPEEVADLLRKRAEGAAGPLSVSEKAYISISQVRELEQRLSRRAYEDRGHVEIISGAEALRVEAANALLKTLEEPPSGTHLVLLSTSVSRLLPTIRSRAQLVRFRRLPTGGIAAEISHRLGLDMADASRIAAASNGSLGRALILAEAGDRERSLDLATKVLGSLGDLSSPELLQLCSAMAKSHGTEGVLSLVMELRALVHDMGRKELGRPCLYHLPEDLPDDASYLPGNALRQLSELLGKCERRIRRNVSPSMALGAALLRAGDTGMAEAGADG